MTVATDMPGVQLYTANWLKGDVGKDGARYNPHDGFCLETQQYPDAPNKYSFPSAVLKAGLDPNFLLLQLDVAAE